MQWLLTKVCRYDPSACDSRALTVVRVALTMIAAPEFPASGHSLPIKVVQGVRRAGR
jgi:hypothetical protein